MSVKDSILPSPAMVVWSVAVVLLLAAGSPPVQAQDHTPLPGFRVPESEPEVSDREVASYGIDTFAGLRVSGDGGSAVEAWLNSPEGVAVDGAGNVYIADSYNHRVRKVDATGTITTIAGSGEGGIRRGRGAGESGAVPRTRRRGGGRVGQPLHR